MNYFYFFFFLTLAVLILIKPFVSYISDWVMRSEKLTKTGLFTILVGAICLYVSLGNEFWYERVWLIITFSLGPLGFLGSLGSLGSEGSFGGSGSIGSPSHSSSKNFRYTSSKS